MACEVALLPGSSGGSAFSPLTLFECTITNAQMLIDSMADRELLQALKIASTLHTHIVGVMEPRYDRVCSRSDAHAACLIAAAVAASSSAPSTTSQPTSSSGPSLVAAAVSSNANGSAADATPLKPWNAGHVKEIKEEQLLIEEDSMDDCMMLEEDASFGSGFTGAGGGGSVRKRPRQELSLVGSSGASAAAGSASAPAHTISLDYTSDCRNALRNSYKEVKGNGPHLFNFSLSFTDAVNQRVAEQVIAHAQRQLSHASIPQDTWWSALYIFAQDLSAVALRKREKFATEKRRQRNRQRKLARRQKSFELLATGLTTDQFDKYRVLLSRDYTSSDEETEEDGGALRVRSLPWESAEMKEMKQQLDETFLQNCATQKQAEQLRRTVRDAGYLSGRAPPTDCPVWALTEGFRA